MNCRLEAQYGYQQKTDMVPLILEEGYRANGWLGLILGARLYYEFFGAVLESEKNFHGKVDEVCREIGHRGLQSQPSPSPPPPSTQAAAPQEPQHYLGGGGSGTVGHQQQLHRSAMAASTAEDHPPPTSIKQPFTPSPRLPVPEPWGNVATPTSASNAPQLMVPPPMSSTAASTAASTMQHTPWQQAAGPVGTSSGPGMVHGVPTPASFSSSPFLSSDVAGVSHSISLSEGFYLQLERERAAGERERAERAAERERDRASERAREREREDQRFALLASLACVGLACAAVGSVGCAITVQKIQRSP